MMTVAVVLPTGVLLPESILQSDSFEILATFVALNSLMYATLAVLKILPKGYALSRFNGRYRRIQNRSIYPEPLGPEASDSGEHASGPAEDLLEYGLDAPARPAKPDTTASNVPRPDQR